jgi:electron transfer flavoprotein-quinone oxidoreductase
VVIEAAGAITEGMLGTAFIYTNRESLSVGIGCLVSDFMDTQISPYGLLESFKRHPSIRPLLAGSEVKEYSAHMLPEGGYKGMPRLVGEGWMIVGDAGQFVNTLHREGSNLAMTTGKLAAETVIELKAERKPMSARNLERYRAKLKSSFVMKDMHKYRHLPNILHHNKQFITTYPELLAGAMETWFRVDGVSKRSKEFSIMRNFVKERSMTGLVGDVIKIVRAIR